MRAPISTTNANGLSISSKLRLSVFTVLVFFLGMGSVWGQTNPTAQSLPYTQNFSTFTGSITTYPAGIQGWTIAGSLSTSFPTAAPNSDQSLAAGTNASTTAGVYDMNNKIGLANTGSALRAICLALNTTGLSSINVEFVAATQRNENTRVNEIALQYRLGTSGTFTNVSSSGYQNNLTTTQTTGISSLNPQTVSVTLPSACNNQAVVQLRWVVRDVSGSGTRPSFSIDNINVSVSSSPTIALSDNGTQVTASNVAAGSTNVILHQSALAVTTANATLNGITFTTAGTYTAADVSNFKVWYSTDNSFAATDVLLGTVSSSLGTGAKSVSSLSQAISSGSTGYIFITTDIAAAPTGNATLNIDALGTSNFTFAAGTKTGSTAAGGTKTLQAATSPLLTAQILGSALTATVGAASNAVSVTASGSNLTNTITITPSTNYEVSVTSVSSGFTSSAINGVTSGTTVWVRLAASATAGTFNNAVAAVISSTGATSVDITTSATGNLVTTPAPANDLCANAIALTLDGSSINGTLAGATSSANTFAYASAMPDLWYKFTPSCSGSHSIEVTFSSGPDIDFDVFTTATCVSTGTAPIIAHGSVATSETVSGTLVSGTTYYLRLIDYNANAGAFAISVTPPVSVAQAVTTSAASSITSLSATLNGNLTAIGNCPPTTEKGFVYSVTSTNSNPQVNGTGVTKQSVNGLSTGAYLLALSNLTAGESYSFRSYAYDGTTYTYGAVTNFTTLTVPNLAVTGTTAHGSVCPGTAATVVTYTITNTGFTANNVVVSSNDAQFVVSTLSSTTIAANGTVTYQVTFTPTSVGSQSATITVYYDNTTQATTSSLTGTGIASVTGVVNSAAVTAITTSNATLNGSISTLGVCPATTQKGFVYSLTSVNTDPVVSGTGVTQSPVSGLSTGAYSLALTGLTAASGYTFKAYVFDGTNYIYGTATSFTTLAAQPTAQPTSFTRSAVGTTNMTIGWVAASGAPSGYLVLRTTASGTTYPTTDPVDGTYYNAGNTLGNATVEYIGSNLSAAISSLTAQTQYSYEVFSFNGTGSSVNYLVTSPLTGQPFTLANEPTAEPTTLTITNISTTTATLTVSGGNGSGVAVFMKAGSAVDFIPTDGVSITSNAAFGSGTQYGTGNYLVLYSSTSPFTVPITGLTASTTYSLGVYAFNGLHANLSNNFYATPAVTSFSTLANAPTTQPTAFSQTAVSTNSMSIAWTAASGAPDGYIVLRTTASSATYPNTNPVDGTVYSQGDILGNATVEFLGSSLSAAVSNLAVGSQYSYEVYSYNGSGSTINYNISGPLQAWAYTLSTEPTAHAASFTATAASATNIDLAFSAASTLPASGYLILKKSTAFDSGDYPVDGNAYAVGAGVGSNGAVVNTVVTSSSVTTSAGTSVAADNTYFYLLVPFNWNGSTSATRNYFTGVTIPTANATTPSGSTDAAVVLSSEATTISSLINDVAPLSSSNGVQVWQFSIRDGGSALNDADALPTKISSITLTQNASSNVNSWITSIKTIALFDGTTLIATGTVGSPTNNISFSGLSLSIPDGQSKTLSVRISLNNTLGVTDDGKKFVFNLTNANLLAVSDGTSSGVTSFTAINSSTSANVIAVVATKLAFAQQASNANLSVAMSPAVTVDPEDANGNRDLDYTTSISLVSTGTLSTSPLTATPSAGLATFNNIVHVIAGTGLQLTANSGSLTAATSNTFDVVMVPITIYQHDFGSTIFTSHPYTVAPSILDANLSNSSWSNNGGTWTTFGGSSGQAISLSSVTAADTWSLTFDVAAGYNLSLTSFSFWRRTSSTVNVNSVTVNGVTISSGQIVSLTSGSNTNGINVAAPIENLTGTITVVLNVSGSGSFRLDDFTLTGNVTCLTPANKTITAGLASLCDGSSTNISVAASQIGVNYQLRNNANNAAIGSSVAGTGSTINLPTGNLTATTTFNVLATSTCGLSSTMTTTPTVTVYSIPAAPTATNQSFCTAQTPTIASLSATGSNIQWYAASTGGSALVSSTSLSNTNYYASQTINGCESSTRTEVVSTINTTPSAPTATATQNFCTSNNPTINSLAATGSGILWYDAATGGNLMSGSAVLTSATYYASQTVNGCESSTRAQVVVNTFGSGLWIGGNGDWSTAANWCGNMVPNAAASNALVSDAVTVHIDANLELNALTIGALASVIVDQDIALTLNSTLTNNGTLTLENGATLVQEANSTASTAANNGYVVKQVVTGAGGSTPNGRSWYLGAPVSGATSNVIAPSASGNLLYHWNASAATPSWAQVTAGAGSSLEVGKGYLIRMGAASTTLNFAANTLNNAPNASPLALPCYRQNSTVFQGFNLVSNPFASYLNWDDVYAANASAFENTIWYRIGNGSGAMVFDTYVAGGVGTNNYGGTAVSSYIPPMQAFWVRLNSSVTPGSSATNLSLTNGMRSHYAGGAGAGLKSNIQDLPAFVRLNLLQDNKKDQVIVYMRPEAQNQYDMYDAEKMFLTNYLQIYTKIGDKKLVINGMKNNKNQTVVPLYLEIPSTGVYVLNTEEFNIENGLILLEDKQEGVIQDLTVNDNYVFYANSGVLTNRFFIRFQLPDPGITATGPSNNWVESQVYQEGGEILISTNGKGKVTVSQDFDQSPQVQSLVQITDASGKQVFEGAFEGSAGEFELQDVQNGIYFVRVELNGKVEVKKIVVQL